MRAALAAAAGVALMACTSAASNDGVAPLSPVDEPRADDVPTDANEGLSAASGHDGGREAAPSPDPPSPAPPADPFAAARKACVDAVNQARATKGLAPLQRYLAKEACADAQAEADAARGSAHWAYLNGAPSCIEDVVLDRQNECPGWYGPPEKAAPDCVAKMFGEGPGSGSAHGHYTVLMNAEYTRVSCGVHVLAGAPSGSAVWIVLNFY